MCQEYFVRQVQHNDIVVSGYRVDVVAGAVLLAENSGAV